MTAEVCVMNKLGIALAADSAVTRDQSSGPKVYQSADKLFLLSEADPVGVMVYGNASFFGVPWETIIKQYRAKHGGATYATVEEHAATLRSFLAANRPLFPDERQRRSFRRDLSVFYKHLAKEIRDAWESAVKSQGQLSESAVVRIAAKMIRQKLSQLAKGEDKSHLPKNHPSVVRRRYAAEIAHEITNAFGTLPITQAMRDNLKKLASQVHLKGEFGDSSSVVVAGFGSEEVFPRLAHFRAQRIVADSLQYNSQKVTQISDDSDACVAPFAQHEMVATFMEGIDPSLQTYVVESLRKFLQEYSGTIASSIPNIKEENRESLVRVFSNMTDKMFTELQKNWGLYRSQHHVGPILSIVGMLPKDELASLAESLVNLTVLKRRTSTDAETVGGPIDVAVITRGDGFVWIKRKHYFSPELNPRFMARLGKGAEA